MLECNYQPQLTLQRHRLRNTPLSAAGCYQNARLALMLFILTDKLPGPVLRLSVCPDPSFPLAHAVKRVRVCTCIEGSGDQTKQTSAVD